MLTGSHPVKHGFWNKHFVKSMCGVNSIERYKIIYCEFKVSYSFIDFMHQVLPIFNINFPNLDVRAFVKLEI